MKRAYLEHRYHCPEKVVKVTPGDHFFSFSVLKFKLSTKQIHSQNCKRKYE